MRRQIVWTSAVLVLGWAFGSGGVANAGTGADGAAGMAPAGQSATDPSRRAAYSVFEGTLADVKWADVKKAADAGSLVLLPVAVIEEHGPHIALGADAYLGTEVCRTLKRELDVRGVPAVIAPPLYWGIMQAGETGAFPGSFTVRPSTMKALILDVLGDLKAWGFRRVYVVNRHGDRVHRRTVAEAIAEAKQQLGLEFYNDQERQDRDAAPDVQRYITGKPYEPDYHAGAGETSAMAAYFPALVDLSMARTLPPQPAFQPRGYVGAPANFSTIDVRAIDRAEQAFYAERIARWMRVTAGGSADR